MKYQLNECIGSRIRRVSRIIDAYFREEAKKFGITENQMTILFALHSLGKVEQKQIGYNLVLERSTVSRNIKQLEKKGYIVRTSSYHPEIELTKEGTKLVLQLIPMWENVMNQLMLKLDNSVINFLTEIERKL
ncbi:MAG: MarR family transcriptional regulator [Saprospiraceae bacterium]|nr:MarR family transcriptional regulator [Saprospiraceae bacterium]